MVGGRLNGVDGIGREGERERGMIVAGEGSVVASVVIMLLFQKLSLLLMLLMPLSFRSDPLYCAVRVR